MEKLARINGIYEGLRTGQFPVQINPVQLGGYGYLPGSMYPQLFLYFPAILKFPLSWQGIQYLRRKKSGGIVGNV